MINKLTSEQIEKLALEIVDFLIKYRLWVDVAIFFNNSVYRTDYVDSDNEIKFVYNDRKNLVRENNINVSKYVKKHNSEHILSISYDSVLYEVLEYGVYEINDDELDVLHERDCFVGKIVRDFYNIFKKYGLVYRRCGNGEITCYYIGDTE